MKPTIEEVKEYFKDAKTIESLNGSVLQIYDNCFEESCVRFSYRCRKTGYLHYIYDGKEGYAKIITYKKPSFRPIVMRCTQEQFKEIEPKLYKIEINSVSKKEFDKYPYLINCDGGLVISNINKTGFSHIWEKEPEIHETWNEKVFLEACGIVVEEPKEETFVITKEQVLRFYYMSELMSLPIFREEIKLMFPSAFVEKKKELVVGKWYKHPEYPKFLTCLREDKTRFGFDIYGTWFQDADVIKDEHHKAYFEATQEEVKSALEKEAVKRYKNQYLEPLNRHLFDRDDERKDCIHLFDSNSLSMCKNEIWMNYGKYYAVIFSNGKWSDIIKPKQMTQSDIEKVLGYKIEIV